MGIIEAAGLRWAVGGPETDDGFGPGDHEAPLEPLIRELAGHGRVFLDVGAHVGHWALRLAGQASRVIAVEASPATAAVLRENIALNGLGNAVTVIEAAAWDSEAVLHLSDPVTSQVRGACTRTVPDGPGPAVRAAPLDSLLDPGLDISLIKLDVEGADLHALRGMAGTLARCRPAMLIERHDVYGCYTISEMHDLLAVLGYGREDGPECRGSRYLTCRPA